MTDGFPIDESAIRQIAGLYLVVLPNLKYPDYKLTSGGLPVANPPAIDFNTAKRVLHDVNEWARKRGGRPANKSTKVTVGPKGELTFSI